MLQIEKTGINMISKEYKESLKTLEVGEIARFQIMNGVPNNDPVESERNKRPMLYGHDQLLTHFKIKDPFGKNHVEVGIVEDFSAETGFVTKWKTFVPNMFMPQNPGIFTLTGGNQEDDELYEILQMSPENRDNPYRDKKTEPKFYEIKQHKVNFDAFKRQPVVIETNQNTGLIEDETEKPKTAGRPRKAEVV